MVTHKILLVDDDLTLLDVIKYNLVKDQFDVITAENGVQAVDLARTEKPNLIILDLMLPGLHGFEVCRIVRQEMKVPILILTARTDEVDKVVGLDLGADDYMTKPFSMKELISRVRAILRRSQRDSREITPDKDRLLEPNIKAGDFEVDFFKREIFKNNNPLHLSSKEFNLLAFLVRHRGQVFSRQNLVEKLWEHDYTGTARTVDVHIRSLRCKIEENPDEPRYLMTVQRVGYKFNIQGFNKEFIKN